jgi:hypothetical protein
VDERSVDARLGAVGAATEPSLRERWAQTFDPGDLALLVGHLKSLAGTTVTFDRVAAWVAARKP